MALCALRQYRKRLEPHDCEETKRGRPLEACTAFQNFYVPKKKNEIAKVPNDYGGNSKSIIKQAVDMEDSEKNLNNTFFSVIEMS